MKAGPTVSLRILIVGLWSVGLVLAAVVGGLVWRGIASARQTEQLRHEVIATRVFDEMERELTLFVANEEARPFTHYRQTYVPDGEEVAQASPLSQLPEHPAVLAYVQVRDIDGEPQISLPLSEQAKAERTDRQLEATRRAIGALGLADAPVRGTAPSRAEKEPDPQQQMATPSQAQAARPPGFEQEVAIQQALNTGADIRNDRQTKKVNPSGNALDNFNDPQAPGSNLVELAPRKKQVAPTAADGSVVIAPFEVENVDELVVMHRRVAVGETAFEQVVVLDSDALLASLGDAVLSRGELASFATLIDDKTPRDGDGDGDGDVYRYEHVFAPPFSLVGHLSLRSVPGPGAHATTTLWILGGVVLIVLIVGLTALQRAVTATVSYAEQRNDFVSAVTHELRTPLTTINMYAEMLEADMVPPERRAEYLSTLREQAQRLGGLVEDVLTMAKLERRAAGEASRIGDDPVPAGVMEPLSDVVHGVVSVLEPQAKRQGVDLQVELGREVTQQSVIAPAIERILTNLMGNAIKFAPEGRVHLVGRAEGQTLVLLVRDDGPGVAPELLTTIFEPFYRAERELTRKTQGTGIGLSLVARIVETLDGTVKARNREPHGLEIEIRLPTATQAK